MAEEEHTPRTETADSLDPPPRKPPSAVGLGAGHPDPDDHPFAIAVAVAKPNLLGRFLTRAFDVLDEAADTVAGALHIR